MSSLDKFLPMLDIDFDPSELVEDGQTDLYSQETPFCQLIDAPIWRTLNMIGSEMMYTTAGRRIFPIYNLKFTGLDPHTYYVVAFDLTCDGKLFKFDKEDREWLVKGFDEECSQDNHLYFHPVGAQVGSYWMEHNISFEDARIAKPMEGIVQPGNCFTVQSGHRYSPRFHLIRFDEFETSSWTYEFGQMLQFHASTHYRNPMLASYKAMLNIHVTNSRGIHALTEEDRKKLTELLQTNQPGDILQDAESIHFNVLKYNEELATYFMLNPVPTFEL